MAYDFDGINDKISLGDIALDGLTTTAMSLWVNFDALADFDIIFSKTNGAFTSRIEVQLGGAGVGDNNEVIVAIGNGASNSYGNSSGANIFTTGTWAHIFWYYDGNGGLTSSDRLKAWANGSELTLSYGATTIPATLATHADSAYIGGRSASDFMNGKVAELAIWTGLPGGMAAAQAAALLAKGYSPNFLRKNGLHYYPLVRDATDHWGGNTGTVTEAAAYPHPRIIMPVRSRSRKSRYVRATGGTANGGILIGGRLIA